MVDSMIEWDRDFSDTSEAIENNFISLAPPQMTPAPAQTYGEKREHAMG
jgi:hypothetical protein